VAGLKKGHRLDGHSFLGREGATGGKRRETKYQKRLEVKTKKVPEIRERPIKRGGAVTGAIRSILLAKVRLLGKKSEVRKTETNPNT